MLRLCFARARDRALRLCFARARDRALRLCFARARDRALRPWRAALVLVLLGACYGSDPEFASDEQDALDDLSESATPVTEPTPETEAALADEAEAEMADNMLRELDSLYADPEQARTREQQARSELEQGAKVDRDAVEFARLLAEQLQTADPDQATPVGEGESKAPPAGDAGLLR